MDYSNIVPALSFIVYHLCGYQMFPLVAVSVLSTSLPAVPLRAESLLATSGLATSCTCSFLHKVHTIYREQLIFVLFFVRKKLN
jgi:hypothetical protein